jgi:DNA-binding winged helix-turn-helix (wHTH) protein
MKGAWGRSVERPTFTQRIHQLRKKLKEYCGDDVITNHYGGYYSLVHPDWLDLE